MYFHFCLWIPIYGTHVITLLLYPSYWVKQDNIVMNSTVLRLNLMKIVMLCRMCKLQKLKTECTFKTRMHSSRMRTVRNSSRLLRGVSAPGGHPSMHRGRPPLKRMTYRCKNISFATSLRTVKSVESSMYQNIKVVHSLFLRSKIILKRSCDTR